MKQKSRVSKYIISVILFFLFSLFFSCASKPIIENEQIAEQPTPIPTTTKTEIPSNQITLLFAGDIMAHSVNYNISTYEKIWRDVKYLMTDSDVIFGNIEAPIDTTKPASSYPNFNMTKKYVQSSIDAGFNVFSLCNNHTNDQLLTGIKETLKTTEQLTKEANEKGNKIYFSGTKSSPESPFSYNLIEKNGWKILFLPMTELLNRPDASSYINFVKPTETERQKFADYAKKIKAENPCDLFIISIHTAEPEYTRVITEKQEKWYNDLLECGADIVWANHAHIIKNRKVIVNTQTSRDSLIMYANGNTISGQRTKPDFGAKNPTGERDNTGDGLFYKVILQKEHKEDTKSLKIVKATPIFITTYINTANEYVIKPLNQEFVDYLYSVPRTQWAKYIEKRIKINNEATKDLIEWR